MRSILMGETQLESEQVRYYLLAEQMGEIGENYGVQVCKADGEVASIPGITMSSDRISGLVDLLVRAQVTPVSLWDVVEDWLAQ